METNKLIVVEQLPIITERLRSLGDEIDKDISDALSLACTEESVKEVKKIRASLTKAHKTIEEKRKEVKNAVMSPYNEFEEVYKTYVSDKYKAADTALKERISLVEDDLKKEKENEVQAYFAEYISSKNIDFIDYERACINVTLSSSLKALKNQVKDFIDKVAQDLEIIEIQEFRDEILIEYKKDLDVSNSIKCVTDRHKAIVELRERQVELKEKKNIEDAAVEKVEEVIATEEPLMPPNEEVKIVSESEEVYEVNFNVRGTKAQMKALKQFLIDGGYEYE